MRARAGSFPRALAALACALAAAFVLFPRHAPAHPIADADRDAARERRKALRGKLGDGYALVFAQPFTDVLQPRQEGHFLYLTSVREPGGVLLLGPETEALYLPPLNPRMAQFYGHEFLPTAETGARLALEARPLPRDDGGLAGALAALLPERARVHVPTYGGSDQATVRERRRRLVDDLKKRRPDLEFPDLAPVLESMRAVKDELELGYLRRAIAITEEGFREAARCMRAGAAEADVESALMRVVRARGARPSFPFVVGAGANAAIPHYFANDGTMADGDLLVVDAGAAHRRYAADLTRTFPVSGTFTDEQKKVYRAVLEAQRAGIAAVRPGASFRDIHKAAFDVLAKHGLAAHFLHGTSHHVGLDAHDPGPSKSLVPGMTLTVEPGVYIREKRLGIRIEDIVRVTEDGCEVLSQGLPKEPGEVEAWLAKHRDAR